jgi:hypothetical protein
VPLWLHPASSESGCQCQPEDRDASSPGTRLRLGWDRTGAASRVRNCGPACHWQREIYHDNGEPAPVTQGVSESGLAGRRSEFDLPPATHDGSGCGATLVGTTVTVTGPGKIDIDTSLLWRAHRGAPGHRVPSPPTHAKYRRNWYFPSIHP